MSDPWLKFYPTDWRSDPRLRMCGIAARGLWIEMIALMHEAVPYGHLIVSGHSPTDAQLAVLAGMPSAQVPELLGELESAGVFSRTREGVIYSRKLTRMAKKAATARKNGKNGGNPNLGKEREILASDNPQVKPPDKPQKPEARSQIDIEPLAQQSNAASAAPRKHDQMHQRLLEANGLGGLRDEKGIGLAHIGPILALVESGIDFELDVLAGIRINPKPQAKTWAYFVPQIEEYARKRRGLLDVATTAAPETDWTARLEAWRQGTWGSWGPKPGEPGCQVPKHLLEAIAA